MFFSNYIIIEEQKFSLSIFKKIFSKLNDPQVWNFELVKDEIKNLIFRKYSFWLKNSKKKGFGV